MNYIRQIEDDWDDEKNCVVSPAILNTSWTSESIQQWCKDRTKKYPTLAKAEKVELVRQFREDRKKRMRSEMKERSEHISKRAKRDRPQFQRKPRNIRKYGDYEFPDCDQDEEGVKEGIFMFKGTKIHEQDLTKKSQESTFNESLPISDSDNGDSTLSDADEPVRNPIESAKVMEFSFNVEDDDDAPQAVSIKKIDKLEIQEPKVLETVREKTQPQPSPSVRPKSSEKPHVTAIKDEKFNEDYLRVLRKKKSQETFLEKLLENEIIRERHELLQCLHFVVTNNFFDE